MGGGEHLCEDKEAAGGRFFFQKCGCWTLMTLYHQVRLVWPSDFKQQLIHCCVTDALLPGHRGRTPLLIFSFFFPHLRQTEGPLSDGEAETPPPGHRCQNFETRGGGGRADKDRKWMPHGQNSNVELKFVLLSGAKKQRRRRRLMLTRSP